MAKRTQLKAKNRKKSRTLKVHATHKARTIKKPVKIDQRLLDLQHSSLKRISQSLEKIENFSADLAEKSGVTGMLGRAVLMRAKMIRESLKTKSFRKNESKSKPKPKSQPKPKSRRKTRKK